MPRKNSLLQFHSVVDGNMNATITSPVTSIRFLDNIGVQINFSGSPVGSFAVQVSADYAEDNNGNVTNSGNWTSLALTPAPDTTSGSPIYLDLFALSAPWIRVKYTRTSGTGTLNVYITGKEI